MIALWQDPSGATVATCALAEGALPTHADAVAPAGGIASTLSGGAQAPSTEEHVRTASTEEHMRRASTDEPWQASPGGLRGGAPPEAAHEAINADRNLLKKIWGHLRGGATPVGDARALNPNPCASTTNPQPQPEL